MIVVAVFSGCANASSAPTTAGTPTPATTTTPTPAVEPALTAPAQVFGADCASVFTTAGVGAALGASMVTADPWPATDILGVAVRTGGGINCVWAEASVPSGAFLSVVVLPAALMTSEDNAAPWCYASSMGGPMLPACNFDISRSGHWLSGVAYTAAGTAEDDVRNAIAKITDQFATSAAVAPRFNAAPRPADAWPAVDCGTLSTSGPVSALLGGFRASEGNGPAEVPGGFSRAARAAGNTNCIWQRVGSTPAGASSSFTVQTLPSGAWVQAQIAELPGATEVAMPSADRAVSTTVDNRTTLNVFDGSNWLTIEVGHQSDQTVVKETYGPIAVALVTALDQSRDQG